ncbi:MAG: TIGR00375 family protein [Methermicoccaceae archaeon]
MQINCDLHIHSKYSAATSKLMDFERIAIEARKKGIQLVGSGDCLHPKWLDEAKRFGAEDGVFSVRDVHFVLTVEVEDSSRVHHLILVPDTSKAEELYEAFSHYSHDIDINGRPRVILNGEEVAEHAVEAECLVGPAHAFTPWTALYAYHNSLADCYGDMKKKISFLELGLSADSDYADTISDLHELTFLTNSDAHSPWLDKFAREFTRFELDEVSFEELAMGIHRKNGRRPLLNVGFYPEEGKYNESACVSCYKHYTLTEAIARGWRCECGGLIKKGVKDRVKELADLPSPVHPPHRPPYIHIIPLADIIRIALGHGSTHTKGVRTIWEELIGQFGSEIAVLIDTPIEDIRRGRGVTPAVANAIEMFRKGELEIQPGGGGKYGVVQLPDTFSSTLPLSGGVADKSKEHENIMSAQKDLFDFE